MNDQIFAWGSNEYNQCFKINDKIVSPYNGFIKKYGFDNKIVSIATGASHCMILTDQGEVYSWGSNNNGQMDSSQNSLEYPPKMEFSHHCMKTKEYDGTKIRKISAGGMFSVFLTDCGCIIRRGSTFGDANQSMDVPFPSSTWSVTDISCGISHVILLLSFGHVACFGRNMYGQIGIERKDLDRHIETVSTPRIVTKNFIYKITKISAGSYHSLCCDEINQIFCWGYGIPCGIVTGHVMQPSYLTSLNEPIRNIAAGSSHSLFLTESRDMYAIGGNEFGQAVPNSDSKYIDCLTKIQYFKEEIEEVFCGEYYSGVKTGLGNICLWGKNSLIIDHTLPISSCFHTPQTVISRDFLGDNKVVSVSCGSWHILCHISTASLESLTDVVGDEDRIITTSIKEDSQDDMSDSFDNFQSNYSEDHLISRNCGNYHSGQDIISTTMLRERTHTTLRELYSKTPNQFRRLTDNDGLYSSSRFLQSNSFNKISTELPSHTGHTGSIVVLSPMETKKQNFEYDEDNNQNPKNDVKIFKENICLDVKLSSRPKFEGQSKTFIYNDKKTPPKYVPFGVSSNHNGASLAENKQYHLPKIFCKNSTEGNNCIWLRKSKTEFLTPSKYCFVSKRFSEDINPSLMLPHKLDLELNQEYAVALNRSFIFKGKIRTSLGRNSTIMSGVKYGKSK